jgi:nucleotide-binding universal stress UspA family protein
MMNSPNELVMEQPAATKGIAEAAAAPIKSILFVVHDDDGLDRRLQAALSLARACSAHLQLLQVIPLEAFTVVDTYGGTFFSGEIVEALEEQASKVRARLEGHLRNVDVRWSYEATTSATLPALLNHAAFADLMFVGREPRWHEFGRTGPGLLGALVCNTRTPLCIPGDECETFDPFGNALVAWNGSIEAANTVRSAIGLLRMASEVRVVRFAEEKVPVFPDTSILEYLSRHGVHAEIETRAAKTDAANDLVERAGRMGAEYIVMGGYSHSRAGQFLFGGVTHALLRACPISLVMTH